MQDSARNLKCESPVEYALLEPLHLVELLQSSLEGRWANSIRKAQERTRSYLFNNCFAAKNEHKRWKAEKRSVPVVRRRKWRKERAEKQMSRGSICWRISLKSCGSQQCVVVVVAGGGALLFLLLYSLVNTHTGRAHGLNGKNKKKRELNLRACVKSRMPKQFLEAKRES